MFMQENGNAVEFSCEKSGGVVKQSMYASKSGNPVTSAGLPLIRRSTRRSTAGSTYFTSRFAYLGVTVDHCLFHWHVLHSYLCIYIHFTTS